MYFNKSIEKKENEYGLIEDENSATHVGNWDVYSGNKFAERETWDDNPRGRRDEEWSEEEIQFKPVNLPRENHTTEADTKETDSEEQTMNTESHLRQGHNEIRNVDELSAVEI